ncbi:MAG: efflux RND transporter periplasmic adaptor subunit [Bacteroidales bacterium]|nr:efflux RND transporter periplasmic adaptor subunit [Bacteroidales bacterium]
MKISTKTILFLLAFSAFNVLISCKDGAKEATNTSLKKMPLVKVQPALKSTLFSYIDITGTIEANIFTNITAPADGIVESLRARENQRVEKDKIIAIINPSDRVSLISNNQLQVLNLEEKLKDTDKGSGEYDQLVQELEKSKNDLEYAKKMYQVIPVICPMTGLVTERFIDEGSQVLAKEKMLTISDMSTLVIKAEVNEKYFEVVYKGKILDIMLNAYPYDSLTGMVSMVYPQVDPATRSVKFDIKIQNFHKSLLPGMMASIKIPVNVSENTLTVPEQAVLYSPENESFLFIVDKDSVAHRVMIETGMNSENKLAIKKGLIENDIVVVSGHEMLKEGMKVKIAGNQRGEK